MHGASGKRHRVVASSSPRVAFLPLLVGKDEQDLGRKTRGGRCPRGNVEGVFLTNTGSCSPGAVASRLFVRASCCIMMHQLAILSKLHHDAMKIVKMVCILLFLEDYARTLQRRRTLQSHPKALQSQVKLVTCKSSESHPKNNLR